MPSGPLQVRRDTDANRKTATFAAGEPFLATDSGLLAVGDGSTLGGQVVGFRVFSASVYVPDPTSSDDIGFPWKMEATTIVAVRHVLVGAAGTLTWNLHHATTRDAAVVARNDVFSSSLVTTQFDNYQEETGGFDDESIPADSFLTFVSTGKTGTSSAVELTIYYSVD